MTATRATEAERRAMEAERRMGEMLIELGQWQEKTDPRLEEMMQAIMGIKLHNQAKFASEDRFQKKKGGVATMADAESSSVEEEDPIVQLRSLKQVSHIRSYIEAFDELNSRAGIEEDQALSLFLSGLVDELRLLVRMFNPKTLADVYALSKLQELTMTGVLWCDREEGSNLRRNEKLDKDLKVGGVTNGIDGSMELSNLCSERVIVVEETKPSSYSLGIDNKGIAELSESFDLTWSLSESSNWENLKIDQCEKDLGAHLDNLSSMIENGRIWKGWGDNSSEFAKLTKEENEVSKEVSVGEVLFAYQEIDETYMQMEEKVVASVPMASELVWLTSNLFTTPKVKMKMEGVVIGDLMATSALMATSTLMETHDFGKKMEHVVDNLAIFGKEKDNST